MRTILLLLLTAAIALTGCSKGKYEPRPKAGFMPFRVEIGEYAVIDSANTSFVYYEKMIASELLQNADVIFVGEEHDHSNGHIMEAKILADIALPTARPVSLSLEMFERDVQSTLDSYLKGDLSEADFLKTSRPWANYNADYRPMVEFAKSRSMPVIAANIPRPLAMVVGKGGVEAVPEDSRSFVAKELFAPDDEYKTRFIATMKGIGGAKDKPGMQIKEEMLEAIYRAQCIKDDTMAESIVTHAKATGRRIIHYNGCFHSDYGLGTAVRVKRLAPELKVAIIRIARTADKPVEPFTDMDLKVADFILLFTK